jgi:exonuclease III
MDHNYQWNYLGWKIRGINSQPKWDVIHSKVQESPCSIICLQETKREHFDEQYLKQFCPSNLNCFEISPLVGASGSLIMIWNNNLFDGVLVLANTISVIVKLTFKLSG